MARLTLLAASGVAALAGLAACGASSDPKPTQAAVALPRVVAVDSSRYIEGLAFGRDDGVLAFADGVRAVRPDGELGNQVVAVAEGTPLALSPDGGTLIVESADTASAVARPLDGGPAGWSVAIPRSTFGEPSAHWSGDGSRLLIATEEGSLVLDAKTGRRVGQIPASSRYYGAQPLSRDGAQIVQATSDGLRVRDVRAGATWRSLAKEGTNGASWSPDGRTIAADGPDGKLVLVDATSGEARTIDIPLVPGGIAALRWSPDSRYVGIAGSKIDDPTDPGEFRIALVDVRAGTAAVAASVKGRGVGDVEPFAWSADGKQIAYWRDQGD